MVKCLRWYGYWVQKWYIWPKIILSGDKITLHYIYLLFRKKWVSYAHFVTNCIKLAQNRIISFLFFLQMEGQVHVECHVCNAFSLLIRNILQQCWYSSEAFDLTDSLKNQCIVYRFDKHLPGKVVTYSTLSVDLLKIIGKVLYCQVFQTSSLKYTLNFTK